MRMGLELIRKVGSDATSKCDCSTHLLDTIGTVVLGCAISLYGTGYRRNRFGQWIANSGTLR